MHGWIRVLTLFAAFACVAGPATADDGFTICGRAYDPENPFAWQQVQGRYRERIESTKYESLVVSLRVELLDSAAQVDRYVAARFDRAVARLELIFPGQCSEFAVSKDEGGRELAPAKYWLFRANPEEAILLNGDCEDEARVAQMQELRHLSGSLVELCNLALREPTIRAADRIEEIEARYERYLFEGYPMFPWEALVNSWVLAPSHLTEGPPRDQIVLFHPLAGVVLKTTSFSEAEPDLSLGIDVLGWVHYPERADYRSWWGLSAMASVANDRGLGLGLALQWDNFRLAAVYHDDDLDGRLFDDRPSVFLGLDLYHFVKEKYRTYEPYRAKVRELAE